MKTLWGDGCVSQKITLIGAPLDSGKSRKGCVMGPDAYRVAQLGEVLAALGHEVEDRGNLQPALGGDALSDCQLWTKTIAQAFEIAHENGFPLVMGGDHALAMGSLLGAANYAARAEKPLFVLWLDAHSDVHTPETSDSGHIHGMPLGYALGRPGFDGFPVFQTLLAPERLCYLGLRSVDGPEAAYLATTAAQTVDMRRIDEHGIAKPLASFLNKVKSQGGLLHVSLDVDFLDPDIAPAVGTTVPGGATLREAHLVMEMLCDSGLVSSLDLVELNPFLDERGRTAKTMVDLTASLFGRRVFDRETRSF